MKERFVRGMAELATLRSPTADELWRGLSVLRSPGLKRGLSKSARVAATLGLIIGIFGPNPYKNQGSNPDQEFQYNALHVLPKDVFLGGNGWTIEIHCGDDGDLITPRSEDLSFDQLVAAQRHCSSWTFPPGIREPNDG